MLNVLSFVNVYPKGKNITWVERNYTDQRGVVSSTFGRASHTSWSTPSPAAPPLANA